MNEDQNYGILFKNNSLYISFSKGFTYRIESYPTFQCWKRRPNGKWKQIGYVDLDLNARSIFVFRNEYERPFLKKSNYNALRIDFENEKDEFPKFHEESSGTKARNWFKSYRQRAYQEIDKYFDHIPKRYVDIVSKFKTTYSLQFRMLRESYLHSDFFDYLESEPFLAYCYVLRQYLLNDDKLSFEMDFTSFKNLRLQTFCEKFNVSQDYINFYKKLSPSLLDFTMFTRYRYLFEEESVKKYLQNLTTINEGTFHFLFCANMENTFNFTDAFLKEINPTKLHETTQSFRNIQKFSIDTDVKRSADTLLEMLKQAVTKKRRKVYKSLKELTYDLRKANIDKSVFLTKQLKVSPPFEETEWIKACGYLATKDRIRGYVTYQYQLVHPIRMNLYIVYHQGHWILASKNAMDTMNRKLDQFLGERRIKIWLTKNGIKQIEDWSILHIKDWKSLPPNEPEEKPIPSWFGIRELLSTRPTEKIEYGVKFKNGRLTLNFDYNTNEKIRFTDVIETYPMHLQYVATSFNEWEVSTISFTQLFDILDTDLDQLGISHLGSVSSLNDKYLLPQVNKSDKLIIQPNEETKNHIIELIKVYLETFPKRIIHLVLSKRNEIRMDVLSKSFDFIFLVERSSVLAEVFTLIFLEHKPSHLFSFYLGQFHFFTEKEILTVLGFPSLSLKIFNKFSNSIISLLMDDILKKIDISSANYYLNNERNQKYFYHMPNLNQNQVFFLKGIMRPFGYLNLHDYNLPIPLFIEILSLPDDENIGVRDDMIRIYSELNQFNSHWEIKSIADINYFHQKMITKIVDLNEIENLKKERDFPLSHFKPDPKITHIVNPLALFLEGKEQAHCCFVYRSRIELGNFMVFSVTAFERCTLSIEEKNGKWKFSEIKRRFNQQASKETKEYVRDWMKENGIQET